VPVVAETTTTATRLARETPRVLDDAAKGPVTVTRPGKKPAVTLVTRELWREGEQAKHWLSVQSVIVQYALQRSKGRQAGYPAEYGWIRVFDDEDLRDFIGELIDAIYGSLHMGRSWDDVDAVIEEWRRSACAMEDAELAARFHRTLEDIRR